MIFDRLNVILREVSSDIKTLKIRKSLILDGNQDLYFGDHCIALISLRTMITQLIQSGEELARILTNLASGPNALPSLTGREFLCRANGRFVLERPEWSWANQHADGHMDRHVVDFWHICMYYERERRGF